MKKYLSLLITLTLIILMFSTSIFATDFESNYESNTNSALKGMGFSERQIELLPKDTLLALATYEKFDSKMLEFHTNKDDGSLKYFVIATPKEEVAKFDDFSKQALLTLGYSEADISLLPVGYRVEIATDKEGNQRLDAFDSSIAQLETSESEKIENTRGQISDTQIALTTSIIDYGTVSNVNTKRIASTFTWLQDPYFRMTDKLAISYSHQWIIDSSRGSLVYQCYGENTGDLYSFFYYDGQETPGVGIAYENIDIKNVYNDEHTTDHSGWATLFIQHYVNQTNISVLSKVLSKYYYNKANLSGGITLSAQPGISITNESSYDWKQSGETFTWIE